jgi:hypothetical protein
MKKPDFEKCVQEANEMQDLPPASVEVFRSRRSDEDRGRGCAETISQQISRKICESQGYLDM